MSTLAITGNLRKRYIQAAALLFLLDPIHGEPTAYSLDYESHSLLDPMDRVLKRKFLDSFALIGAIQKKDSKDISATCFDKDSPEGTVVRIASNGGVSEITLASMQDILSFLSDIAQRGEPGIPGQPDAETEILYKIIALDDSRIREYLLALQKSRRVLTETDDALQARLELLLPQASPLSIQNFLNWFRRILSIPGSIQTLDSKDLLRWIRWAQQARRVHIQILRAAFVNNYNTLQRWVSYVLKIGRYGIAAKVFIKTATNIPALFSHITVKPVPAPSSVQFGFPDSENPLVSVLRRVPEIKADEILAKLASISNEENIERKFRENCPKDLDPHAELQIVNFYDENPHLKPHSRFIGVSKKSCYLCYNFLSHHPGGFAVSSCHQKLYLSIPPPSTTRKVYQKWTKITTQLCERMENIAREELIERFGLRRSPFPLDSTAGASITDSLDSRAWQVISPEDLDELEQELNEDNGAFI